MDNTRSNNVSAFSNKIYSQKLSSDNYDLNLYVVTKRKISISINFDKSKSKPSSIDKQVCSWRSHVFVCVRILEFHNKRFHLIFVYSVMSDLE